MLLNLDLLYRRLLRPIQPADDHLNYPSVFCPLPRDSVVIDNVLVAAFNSNFDNLLEAPTALGHNRALIRAPVGPLRALLLLVSKLDLGVLPCGGDVKTRDAVE